MLWGTLRQRLSVGAAVLTAVTLAATNVDKLGDLWHKYVVRDEISALSNPRNLPNDLFMSGDTVDVELLQAASEEPGERVYDLYLRNGGTKDIVLSEVKYGPGAAYASAGADASSRAMQPNASYRIVASRGRGSAALSPPYLLRANAQGAVRLVLQAPAGANPTDATLAFEIYSASGEKVASVNRMLGR